MDDLNNTAGETKKIQGIQQVAFRKQIQFLGTIVSQRSSKFIQSYFQLIDQVNQKQNAENLMNNWLQDLTYKKTQTKNHLCGKILAQGTLAYKCQECMLEENSVVCVQCFNNGQHNGHNYQRIQVYGGCCDCGDEEKWQLHGSCKNHQPIEGIIEIDKKLTQLYISEMQFLFYIILSNYFQFPRSSQVFKIGCALFSKCLMSKLYSFNQKSLISNQMTSNLFLEPYPNQYSDICSQKGEAIKIKRQCIIDLAFKLDIKQFGGLFIDTLIMLFGVPNFRQTLTVKFSNILLDNPMILESQMMNITCQIFTSHKLIKKLIQSDLFPSLNLNKLSKNTQFQVVSRMFYRYFIDLHYLARLYNGVNIIALRNQFMKGRVNDLSYYQKLSLNNKEQSLDYYGIEYIYFGYFFTMVRVLKNEKQTLLKMMRDLFEEITSGVNSFFYQSKERSFIICLFVYFDGQIDRAIDLDFLKLIGYDSQKGFESFLKILRSSLFMMTSYALTLSNRQFGYRYYTYYSFSFNKVDYLVAMDLLFFRFCIQVYKQFGNPVAFYSLISKTFTDVLSIFQNKELTTNQEEVYDRGKVLGKLTDFIGLLIEVDVCDHYVTTIKSMLKMLGQEQAYNFYGGILASIGFIEIEDFKKIACSFLDEQCPHFQSFIQKCCQWDNKKVKIKQKYQKQFKPYNLGYMKSKKLNRSLQKFMEVNLDKISINQQPKVYKVHPKSLQLIVSSNFIKALLDITNSYINIIALDKQVLNADFPILSKFIQQLLYLYQSTKIPELKSRITKLTKIQSIYSICSPYLKKILSEYVPQSQKIDVTAKSAQNEKHQKQLLAKKNMKLQKFKKKQELCFAHYLEQENEEANEMKQQQNEENQHMVCILCKNSNHEQLGILCFIQKTNLIIKKLLNSDRESYIITSCNHCIHQKCYNQLYGAREYAHCSICKNSCNLLLLLDSQKEIKQQQKKVIKKMEEQEQDYKDDQIEENEGHGFNELSEFLSVNSKKITNSQRNKVYCLQRVQVALAMLDNFQAKVQQEQQHTSKTKAQDQLSMVEIIIDSLAVMILCGLEMDTPYFLKAQAIPCHYLLTALKQSKIKIPKLIKKVDEELKSIETNQKKQNWYSYKFIVQTLLKFYDVEQIQESWESLQLSQEKKCNIKILCNYVKNNQFFQAQQCKSIDFANKVQPFSLFKPPETLDVLSKEIGQCSQCHMVTNQISQCLLCPFKSCTSCTSYDLTEHTHKNHSGACVFLRVDSGIPIYIGGKKSAIFKSIYTNILRESFITGKKDKSKFTLNKDEYENIQRDIRTFRIEQKIRYHQLTTSKVNTKRL